MKLEHLLGAFTRNWPLKLLSLVLSVMVFFVVRLSDTPMRRDQVVYAYPAAAAQGYPAGRAAAAVISAPARQMPAEGARTNETATVKEKVTSAVDAIKNAVVPIKPPPAVVIVAPPPPMATNTIAAAPAVPQEAVPAGPQSTNPVPQKAAIGVKGQ